MKVILIQEHEKIRDRVHFWLEHEVQAKVMTTTSVADAVIEIRDGTEKVDLVIFDYQTNLLKEFRTFRKELGPALPVVLCMEAISAEMAEFKDSSRTQVVNRKDMIDGIAQAIVSFKSAGALNDEADVEGAVVEGANGEFCRVRTPLLLSVVPLKGDIFIKLSAQKFVKLFNQGDQFESTDYEKYTRKKGVEYLYLKRDAVQEFLVKYTGEISSLLTGNDDLSVVGQSEISVHEIVHELNKNVGFSPSVEALVRTQMRATLVAIEKTPKLRDILAKVESLKGDYLHLHSVLTGHIACGLATEMSWSKNLTYQKLSMAAFLHDVALKDHKLAKISTIEEFDRGLYGAEAKKDFLEHPTEAALLVNKFREVPPDVDKIIVQHHERPDQTGFPHKIGPQRLTPLSCIFIIAHEMADFQINNAGKGVTVKDFLKEASKTYSSSVFRKILNAVENSFSNG